jgi:hypothetical protein
MIMSWCNWFYERWRCSGKRHDMCDEKFSSFKLFFFLSKKGEDPVILKVQAYRVFWSASCPAKKGNRDSWPPMPLVFTHKKRNQAAICPARRKPGRMAAISLKLFQSLLLAA